MAIRFTLVMALFAMTLSLTGCETPQQRVEYRENLLSAAGFVQFPANTMRRRAALQTLPQGRIVRTLRGESITYVLADPLVCSCLYIGDQEAWGRYQRERLRLQLGDEKLTESMNWEAGSRAP
jgi:hypothetical protein